LRPPDVFWFPPFCVCGEPNRENPLFELPVLRPFSLPCGRTSGLGFAPEFPEGMLLSVGRTEFVEPFCARKFSPPPLRTGEKWLLLWIDCCTCDAW